MTLAEKHSDEKVIDNVSTVGYAVPNCKEQQISLEDEMLNDPHIKGEKKKQMLLNSVDLHSENNDNAQSAYIL